MHAGAVPGRRPCPARPGGRTRIIPTDEQNEPPYTPQPMELGGRLAAAPSHLSSGLAARLPAKNHSKPAAGRWPPSVPAPHYTSTLATASRETFEAKVGNQQRWKRPPRHARATKKRIDSSASHSSHSSRLLTGATTAPTRALPGLARSCTSPRPGSVGSGRSGRLQSKGYITATWAGALPACPSQAECPGHRAPWSCPWPSSSPWPPQPCRGPQGRAHSLGRPRGLSQYPRPRPGT